MSDSGPLEHAWVVVPAAVFFVAALFLQWLLWGWFVLPITLLTIFGFALAFQWGEWAKVTCMAVSAMIAVEFLFLLVKA